MAPDTYEPDKPTGWVGDYYFKDGKIAMVRMRDGEYPDREAARFVAETFGLTLGEVYRRAAEHKAAGDGHMFSETLEKNP